MMGNQWFNQWLDRWLDPLVIVTALALLVYAFIFVAMLRQLGEMRGATDAARRSADAATQSANISQKTLIATQRAWISVEATIGSPLVFDERGASTTIHFRVKNVGNTPATHIMPRVWLGVLKEGGPFAPEEQTRRCNEVRQGAPALGFTLFPGQSFPETQGFASAGYGVNIKREEIEKGLLASFDKRRISLFIVGCVDYTFPSDPEHHHQTGFIFDLERLAGGIPGPIIPEEGTIPAANLRLFDSPLGLGRYAD